MGCQLVKNTKLLSVFLCGSGWGEKKSTLAQKNSWEGAEGKGAIAGYF